MTGRMRAKLMICVRVWQDVGVFDATNTTDERRKKVMDHALKCFGPDAIQVCMHAHTCLPHCWNRYAHQSRAY